MKIHCSQLVEGALKAALTNDPKPTPAGDTPEEHIPSLMDSLNKDAQPTRGKLRILEKED